MHLTSDPMECYIYMVDQHVFFYHATNIELTLHSTLTLEYCLWLPHNVLLAAEIALRQLLF